MKVIILSLILIMAAISMTLATTTVTTSGTDATLTITYTCEETKASNIIMGAAEYIHKYLRGKSDFAVLDNSKKLDLIDKYVKSILQELAKQKEKIEQVATTEQSVEDDAAINLRF